MSDTIAADQLRLFIERIERLEEEKKGMADDIRDVYSEAKGQGYDTKTMRDRSNMAAWGFSRAAGLRRRRNSGR
jgi:uncharacterized protein (UPF0335 family)